MHYTFLNSGIPESVDFPECAVNEIFLPLLRRLTALQREKQRRILVLLAAPPGCGKSTLADFLQYLSANTPGITKLTAIGMDGFHHCQDWLLSHTVIRGGEELPMVKIKGAPATFDLPILADRVGRLVSEPETGWPRYDRLLHNPVENAVTVSGNIVLLEGNYLLLQEEGWRELRGFADYTVKMTAQEDFLRMRLVNRKISTGVTRAEAEAFVDFSDMANVRVCLAESGPADLEIAVGDGEYRLIRGKL